MKSTLITFRRTPNFRLLFANTADKDNDVNNDDKCNASSNDTPQFTLREA